MSEKSYCFVCIWILEVDVWLKFDVKIYCKSTMAFVCEEMRIC